MLFLLFFLFFQMQNLENAIELFFDRYLSWEKLSREHQCFKAKEVLNNFKEFEMILDGLKGFEFRILNEKEKRKLDLNIEIETIPVANFGKSKIRIGGDEFGEKNEIDKSPYDYTVLKKKIDKKYFKEYNIYYGKSKDEYTSNFRQSNFRVKVEIYIFIPKEIEVNQNFKNESLIKLRVFSFKDICFPRSKPSKYWRTIKFYGIYEYAKN